MKQLPDHALISFNGILLDQKTPIATACNRSLRYGDGLFETLLWNGSQILNPEFHLDRLFHGLGLLHFDLSAGFTREMILNETGKICCRNAGLNKARVRLNVFREDSQVLKTENNRPVFIIETADLSASSIKPLNLSIYKQEKKSTGQLSNLKTNNYLLFILALQEANLRGFDDALILNHRDRCCETSSSNLFIIRDGIVFTPSLTEGCVAGTKRRLLLEKLPSSGFEIMETIIPIEMLETADEIFLTNAIRGVQPVSGIDDRTYQTSLTEKIKRIMEKEMD